MTTDHTQEDWASDRPVFQPGVLGAIRHAIAFNLVAYHRMYGPENLAASDLYVDIITALRSVEAENPQTALFITATALTEATEWEGGPTLEAASCCLIHSLTQGGHWDRDRAERFVTAALLTSH